jgi:hypothetical protein
MISKDSVKKATKLLLTMIAKRQIGRTWDEVRIVLFALNNYNKKIYTMIRVSRAGVSFAQTDIFPKVRPVLDRLGLLYERGTDENGPYFKLTGYVKS